ncbi:MAG: hypothetical protein JWN73_4820 [Betaproteobacteria bacterium]|nr:hypothetical protein [Betaproteobacteria bacterium]
MIAWLNLRAVGGVVCMIIGFYLVWLGIHKLRRWPRAQGEVINVVRLAGVPTPEIEFTAADGVARTFLAKMPYRQGLRIGTKVKVLYNPASPDDVERLSLMGTVFAPLVFGLFGASQLFCGFWSCKG